MVKAIDEGVLVSWRGTAQSYKTPEGLLDRIANIAHQTSIRESEHIMLAVTSLNCKVLRISNAGSIEPKHELTHGSFQHLRQLD